MIQATETLKLLTGIGTSLVGRLLLYDALAMEWNEFRLNKDADCPVCGESPSVTGLIDYAGFCGMPAREDSRPAIPIVRAIDLRSRLERGEELLLLDVRDPDEFAKASIPSARLIPLSELASRIDELAGWRERPVVVHCHHGPRSARAGALLVEQGFRAVENLDGGIEAWSLTVDPGVPRY
jgi:adenylyltransferase/sulfurtransferase